MVGAIEVPIALARINWAAFPGAHAIRAPEAPAAATYSGAQSVTVDTEDADAAITAAFGDTNRLDQNWSGRSRGQP